MSSAVALLSRFNLMASDWKKIRLPIIAKYHHSKTIIRKCKDAYILRWIKYLHNYEDIFEQRYLEMIVHFLTWKKNQSGFLFSHQSPEAFALKYIMYLQETC